MTGGYLSEEVLPAATISAQNNVTIATRFNMSYGSGGDPKAAGKVLGTSAATCHNQYSTERSITSNNADIMTLGAFVIGHELAKSVVNTWLAAEYIPGGSSEPKVQRIIEYARSHEK